MTAGSTYFTRGEAGSFESQRAPGASAPNRRIYRLTDQLGSTRALTDENGTVVRRYEYDPDGNDASTGSWTASTQLRFASGELDPTGFYHFGQRYYDPTVGRWTQQDPITQASDLRQANRYVYVGGDPVNEVDPSGEAFWFAAAIVAARVAPLAVRAAQAARTARVTAATVSDVASTRAGYATTRFAVRHPRITKAVKFAADLYDKGGTRLGGGD